jgi:hypothetical protein
MPLQRHSGIAGSHVYQRFHVGSGWQGEVFIINHLSVIIQHDFWPVNDALGYGLGFKFDGQKGEFESHCFVVTDNTM